MVDKQGIVPRQRREPPGPVIEITFLRALIYAVQNF